MEFVNEMLIVFVVVVLMIAVWRWVDMDRVPSTMPLLKRKLWYWRLWWWCELLLQLMQRDENEWHQCRPW